VPVKARTWPVWGFWSRTGVRTRADSVASKRGSARCHRIGPPPRCRDLLAMWGGVCLRTRPPADAVRVERHRPSLGRGSPRLPDLCHDGLPVAREEAGQCAARVHGSAAAGRASPSTPTPARSPARSHIDRRGHKCPLPSEDIYLGVRVPEALPSALCGIDVTRKPSTRIRQPQRASGVSLTPCPDQAAVSHHPRRSAAPTVVDLLVRPIVGLAALRTGATRGCGRGSGGPLASSAKGASATPM
jgi:hypothetical protein